MPKILLYSLNEDSIMFIYIVLCILPLINISFLMTTTVICCKLLACCCGVSLLICLYFLFASNINIKFLVKIYVEVLLSLINEVYFSFNYFLKNENILIQSLPLILDIKWLTYLKLWFKLLMVWWWYSSLKVQLWCSNLRVKILFI